MVTHPSSVPKRSRLLIWWDSLTPVSRFLIFTLAAPLAVLNAWAFSTIFSYFQSLFVIVLVASIFAFLLNYPVSFLEDNKVQRGQAAIIVFLLALLIIFGLAVILLPRALTQAQQLVARLPEWLDSGQRQLILLDQKAEELGLPIRLDGLIMQINTRFKNELQTIAGQALNLALNLTVFTVVRLLDVLLIVVLTFYLLQHTREIWQSLIDWLPTKIQQPFSETLKSSFQNYFIGQLITSSCMAFGLVSAFLLLKVPFGLLFGLTIGGMAIVPFGGSVGIFLVTLLVALRDIGQAAQILAIALVVQQIVENGIAPRILGSVTGLNPVWVFISLLTGARIGGLLGVVFAVPTAVLIKEALNAIRTMRNLEEDSQANLASQETDSEKQEPFHPSESYLP